jgi:hypothetical protein
MGKLETSPKCTAAYFNLPHANRLLAKPSAADTRKRKAAEKVAAKSNEFTPINSRTSDLSAILSCSIYLSVLVIITEGAVIRVKIVLRFCVKFPSALHLTVYLAIFVKGLIVIVEICRMSSHFSVENTPEPFVA